MLVSLFLPLMTDALLLRDDSSREALLPQLLALATPADALQVPVARAPAAPAVTRRSALSAGAAFAAGLAAGSAGPAFAALPKEGVFFVEPKDKATVPASFDLKFGVNGLEVRPAKDGVIPGTGHHHLLVDLPAPPAGEPIPFDATHVHFGKGQSEASLSLSPGTHKLTLQFADAEHKSYGPAFAKTITVNVKGS